MIDLVLAVLGVVILGVLGALTIGDRDIWGHWRSALPVGLILLVLAAVSARLGWIGWLTFRGALPCC